MATMKTDMLANVASSMQGRPVVSPGSAATPSSLARRSEGWKRLESAAVIRLDRIVADPNQPRKEFDPESLDRLATSIRERGQLQPIRVRWDDAADRYVVVVGERRWRAAQLAGLESLACMVVAGEPTAEDLLEDQLVENALREDLKPIEQAKAYQSLMVSRGLSTRQLAERLQIGAASVAKALALLTLPGDVQEAVEAGRIAPGTAYELSKVEDSAEQVALAKEAAAGRLRRDEVQARTRTLRKGRGVAKPRKQTEQVFKTTAESKVTVERRRGLDPGLIRAALIDALGQLDAKLGAGDQAAA
ncbi:MAG TPA: ParB/RepB/Spo0J family partition protein [Isosphaeraceae bacterium]|nr:ParB/RepB/Spo0J family partition protein [Isosphaeraceae bacterium]